MTDLNELVEKEIERIKQKAEVKAVAVVGSYARNPEGEHNDIDIYVIVEGQWRKRENKEIDGRLFEIFYNSMEWAKSYFDREQDSYYMFHWLDNIDIRHDPENLFNELIEYAENKKEEILDLDDHDCKMIGYNIWDYEQDIDHPDIAQRRHTMNQFFDYLLEQDYILNQKLPVKENHRIERLQEFDGYMYKLAQEFLTSSSTLKKKQKLEKMADHVKRKAGVESDIEFETEREKFGI